MSLLPYVLFLHILCTIQIVIFTFNIIFSQNIWILRKSLYIYAIFIMSLPFPMLFIPLCRNRFPFIIFLLTKGLPSVFIETTINIEGSPLVLVTNSFRSCICEKPSLQYFWFLKSRLHKKSYFNICFFLSEL